MSASRAPPQAASTIAVSRRFLGANTPGVSTKMSWLLPSLAMPRTGTRVVCTLCETIDTLAPTSALTSVDLPALGAPMTAMKPQRWSSTGGVSSSGSRLLMQFGSGNAFALEQRPGGRLLGSPLRSPLPARRRASIDAHLGGEARRVVGALAADLNVLGQC